MSPELSVGASLPLRRGIRRMCDVNDMSRHLVYVYVTYVYPVAGSGLQVV